MTWGTYAEVVGVLDSASMAGEEEGVRASQPSRHIHSSFARVPRHHSPQGAAACAADTREHLTAVASMQDSEDTSSQGVFGVVGPRSRGPCSGLALGCHPGPGLERGVLRLVVAEWGHSSLWEGGHRTCLDGTQPSGSGMEMGRVASSIRESDLVEEGLVVPVPTLVADACTEKHGH